MRREPLSQVYMPKGDSHKFALGIMLGLCGFRRNGKRLREDSQLDSVCEEANLVGAYPNAINENWRERPEGLADDDSEYLTSVINCYNPAIGRRFAFGHSDGGCKLANDIDRLPLDRIVIYAGYIMNGTRPLEQVSDSRPKVRVMLIRGKTDHLVHDDQIIYTMRMFQNAGHDVLPPIAAEGGHAIDTGVLPLISTFFM